MYEFAVGEKGQLLFVAGEAGVGKSVRVQRFCYNVAGSARTVIGVCDPLSTPQPLGPLTEVADALG